MTKLSLKLKIQIAVCLFAITSPAFAIGSLIVGEMIAAGAVAAGSFAAAAVQFVINFAVSSIVNRVFSKKPPQPQDNGVRQQIPPASTNSLPIVYGSAYLGGVFVDAALTTNQKVMYYVMAISNISPNGQFTFDTTNMYYGDRKITFYGPDPAAVESLTDGAGNVDTKILGKLKITLFTSDASGNITNHTIPGQMPWGTGDGVMGADSGLDAGLQWASTGRKMNGLAFAIIRLVYDREAETTQLQQITFKCNQALNGTGVAKPGDVWYDYITNSTYGGSITSGLVDSTSATALNNYSDQLITFTDNQGNPATQPRYRINGVIDTGQTVLENLDQIVMAADSWMAYDAASGKWSIVINKAESSAFSFNDTNIIGDIRVSTVDINQAINQIEAKFPSKLNKDIPDYVFLETPSGLLYPNEPINKYTLSLNLVNDSVQAQYLCNRMLEQAREDLIVNIKTTYAGIQINAGDVISVTNSAYGWTNKLFRTTKVNEASLPDGSLGAALELNEYNVQIYDDKPITEFQPSPNSDLPASQFFSNLQTPTVSASRPTDSIPSFDVQVYIPATGRVTYIQLYYTTSSTPTNADWLLLWQVNLSNNQSYTPNTYYTFSNMFLPAGTYYFGYKVGNETGVSQISAKSTSFVWNPTGMSGFSGYSGASGYSGYSGISGYGNTGPRNATGFVYYELASASAPSAPTLSSYNFSTGAFGSISTNWTTTFTPPAPVTNPSTEAGSKFWAVRYYVTESSFGGTQTITTSSVFNWQNLDGLVTFTNVTTDSGTTFIDGGNIIADTIEVSKLTAGLLIGFTFRTGSGGHTPNGYSFEVNSSGVVWTDNLVGGVGYFDNYYYNQQGLQGYSSNSRAYEAILGGVDAANSSTSAHGVRGINYNRGTSGLVGPANSYDFYADGSGTNYGPFTGTHDSLVNKNTTFTVGDIVVDTQIIAKNGISSTISLVETSTQPNQQNVLGVVCQEPQSLLTSQPAVYILGFDEQTNKPILSPQYNTDAELYNLMPVNAVGEGQINVCGENGDIQSGDLIVTSSMPGKGMKQGDDIVRSYTVAKAREATTFSSSTEVKTIACIYLSG